MIGDFTPKLVQLTDEVLFGDAWERPGLSARDRSLITVAALVAVLDRQPGSHLRRSLANGLSRDDLVEAITHLAFYAGWLKSAGRTALAGETRSWRGQHAQGNPVPGAICAC